MRIKLFIICSMCAFISCDNKEGIIHDNNVIELTKEEYISIAYDNPKEITDSKVLELVNSFWDTHKTRSNNISTKIKKKFYITSNNNHEIQTMQTKNASAYSMPIYEVELKDANETGYSLVSADERCPAVLAFIPTVGKAESPQDIGVQFMTEIAEQTALTSIANMEAIKDSLREKTLTKLATVLKTEIFSFEQIKEQIRITQKANTKSEVVEYPLGGTLQSELPPIVKVTWNQTAPYNRKLKQACDYNNGYEGRYAAGCAVVCIAQIMSCFEPPMFADGITINWKLLKSSPKVEITDSSERINHISTLMKFIGNRTDTKYSCETGGSTNTGNAIKNFLPLYNIVADSRSGWNADKVKSSLEINSNPIIITGTCDRGNHAWILDGYQKRADSVLGELYYVHSNMGWSGAFDGYFLIQNSMSFQAGGDDYNRNISIYPNVRKK